MLEVGTLAINSQHRRAKSNSTHASKDVDEAYELCLLGQTDGMP